MDRLWCSSVNLLHPSTEFDTITPKTPHPAPLMKDNWSLFWQILRFKRGPEDAPHSPSLLINLIVLDLLLTAVGQSMNREASDTAMIVTVPLIAVTVELVALRLLMAFKSVSQRFVATATVIMGCDVILTLISLPVLLVSLSVPPKSALMMVLGILQMVLLGWSLGFRAFVYHRSLNIGLVQANMLAFTLFLLTMTFTVQAFPELLAKAQAQAAAAQQTNKTE